jgi:peptidoglycan-associated lipoprotein
VGKHARSGGDADTITKTRRATMEFQALKLPLVPAALLLAVSGAMLGCAHVKQDQFDATIAQIRTEVQEGDAAVDSRVDGLADRTSAIEARMVELEGELSDMEERFNVRIDRLEESIRFNVPVHFGFDDAEVRETDRAVLDRFEGVVQSYYPGALVTVEGFTDPAGSAAYNLKLGQARADAVRGYLVEDTGLMGEQVRAVSYGEAAERLVRPEAKGPGAEGQENRRVVLVIDHGGAPPRIISSR